MNRNLLEIHQPKPLYDKRIQEEIKKVMSGQIDSDISDAVYIDFLLEAENYIFSSTLNQLTGHKAFPRKDIIIGCTQFIDNLYMQGPVQVLKHDYKYHERLKNKHIIDHYTHMLFDVPLILSTPFPSTGDVHNDIDGILKTAFDRNCPVHIDGAWITCSQNINFDFNHPAIHSFGISLSKGLGLGWNRVGIRWHRDASIKDSISIMNDFNMNLRAVVKIGLHFVRHFPVDYAWNAHNDNYKRICKELNLQPTNSIHLAMDNGQPVGVGKLLSELENEHTV